MTETPDDATMLAIMREAFAPIMPAEELTDEYLTDVLQSAKAFLPVVEKLMRDRGAES